MPLITLKFSTQKAFDSSIIRHLTWDGDSHVDVVMPDGRLLGARLSGGVQIRPADYSKFTDFELEQVELPQYNYDLVYEALTSQVGKPYDRLAILNYFLHWDKNWVPGVAWTCATLAGWGFIEGFWPLLNQEIPANHYTPRDLKLSTRFI